MEVLPVQNLRAGLDHAVHQGLQSIQTPVPDPDQNPGPGQGGILIGVIHAPGPDLTLIEEGQRADPIPQNIADGEVAVTLLCPTANPDPNTCVGVFGLSLYTTERDIREVFSRYGPLSGVNVVYDQRTGRSRGFAFVYFERIEDSREAMEHANGMELDGRRIRVDYSITKRAHTPTPGIYMGRPTHGGGGGGGGGGSSGGGSSSGGGGRRRDSYYDRGYDRYEEYDYRYRRRSPSPYYSRYRSRSRSRSYSPRRY
ncbi:transformer-2 homolog alpha isoform X1 [Pelobates cultripes]|uniref:Transformer-2 protein homolog alpha n=1 Tax=Pelobates cultripes TaxID=61616 RepID=A0AAD1RYC5_PELCU|nr:transformer-2 homolog alpha isoform X1 [Pelobates cultripes]